MEKLIEKNMALVMSIVNSFHPKNQTERDDYLQAGRIGLWKALKNFNPAKGNVISTYAWNPIRWEIIKEIRSIHPKYQDVKIEDPHYAIYNHPTPFWEVLPSILTLLELKIIEMRLEGYKFKEISHRLCKDMSQVKKNYQRAISKIREMNHE